ncbi:hypothetical protein NC651_031181 [Populus alba x Populus x berolinensis]|nr:hypothetical protein NC651_031181 [Populus alba x Populus x berolinensis]
MLHRFIELHVFIESTSHACKCQADTPKINLVRLHKHPTSPSYHLSAPGTRKLSLMAITETKSTQATSRDPSRATGIFYPKYSPSRKRIFKKKLEFRTYLQLLLWKFKQVPKRSISCGLKHDQKATTFKVEETSTSSQKDILFTTNTSQLPNLHNPQEATADRKLQQQCIEESRQISPASVLERIPSHGNSQFTAVSLFICHEHGVHLYFLLSAFLNFS